MTRRRALVLGGATLVACALVTGLVLSRRGSDAVDASLADLRSNADFASSREAGASLARISERLLDDGRRCEARKPSAGVAVRCERRLAAAGWTSVAARATLTCTQPGTQQIRRDLVAHLEAVRAADRGAGPARPDLPLLPTC